MKKKLMAALLAACMTLSALPLTAFAAPTALTLPGGALKTGEYASAYSDTISAQGGTLPYTYSIAQGTLPPGLTLGADGAISGTPTYVGTYNLILSVTDGAASVATAQYKISVGQKALAFTISNNNYTYDGQPHGATVTPSILGFKDYTVSYSGKPSQTNAGAYLIEIYTSPIYSAQYNTAYLSIRPTAVANITVSSGTFYYDGTPKPAIVTVDPAHITYKIEYEGASGTVYPKTEVAPSDIGTYSITATTTAPNCETKSAYATLNIIKKAHDFTFATTELTYNFKAQKASITPPSGVQPADYAVTYDKATTTEVETATDITDAGTYIANIAMTDPGEQVGTGRTTVINMKALPIDFTVTDTIAVFDGTPKTATIAPVNANVKPSDYTASYDDLATDNVETLSTVTSNGKYKINIKSNTSNLTAGVLSASTLTVYTKKPVDFKVTGNAYTFETGATRKATVTQIGNALTASEYAITYDDASTPDTEALESVTNAGTYNIIVTISNADYGVGTLDNKQLVITPYPAKFRAWSLTAKYDGKPHTAQHACVISGVAYKAQYEDTGKNITDTATAAGAYRIIFTPSDKNFAFGGMETAGTDIFTVEALAIDFAITNASQRYTGAILRPTITATPSIDAAKYSVTYDNMATQTVEAYAEVKDIGKYSIAIKLLSPEYSLGTVTGTTFSITSEPIVTRGYGNSPFGAIMADPKIMDKAAAKAEFKLNNKFGASVPENWDSNAVYSAEAWGANANLDQNDYALFLYDIMDYTEKGINIVDENGITVPKNSITVTFKGLKSMNQIGVAGLADTSAVADTALTELATLGALRLCPGVYEIEYSYGAIKATRPLVLLYNAGDIDMNSAVNGIDASVLSKSTPAANDIYNYRIADVTRDGTVDTADVTAIRNRFVTKIAVQYQR